MSDSEHEVETFETADAGASHTVPMQAGSVRKGGFMVRTTRCDAMRWDAM
jgi:translation initiation factor 5A